RVRSEREDMVPTLGTAAVGGYRTATRVPASTPRTIGRAGPRVFLPPSVGSSVARCLDIQGEAAMPPATTPLLRPGEGTPPPPTGRAEEPAALSTALAATWAGSGGCHVISGPAGIGKTRLLEAAVGEARQLDLAVAVGRATPLDRAATLTTLMSTLHRAEP